MNSSADEPQPEAQTAPYDTGQPVPGSSPDELLGVLRRIERALDEIRGRLEATARAHQHREFSLPRLLGNLCQVLVVGLVGLALADWVYQAPPGRLLVELALAGVLQLGALTGLILARGSH
jgi:hypothetical protein